MESNRHLSGSNEELQQFKLVMTRYYKKCLYRSKYPNLYRDTSLAKTITKGRVYANQDYIHKNVQSKQVRSYQQLEGGLGKPLEAPWNFNAKTKEEDVVEMATACETMDAVFRPDFSWNERRSHIRLSARGRASYVPLVQNIISTPSVPGSYHVNVNRSFIRPDYTFVKDVGQALRMWILHMATVEYQTPKIHFNPGFLNLRLLAAEMRDAVIRHLATTFKKQDNLTELTIEHAFLDSTDALRLLVAAALGAGHTLQKLYLCNLFYPRSLPLETEEDYFDIYDELDYDLTNQPVYLDEMKSTAWKTLFTKPFLDRLPLMKIDVYFRMALSSFSNLTVLMVNYSWLSKGNGLYLLQLECLRNANLRKLILIITPSEDINESRQVISYKAWAYAHQMCPCLELHLILIETAAFIDLQHVLVRSMPLVSVHFTNTYLLEAVEKRKPWSFNYFTRYLGSYFCNKLEIISMTVWHSSCMVDLSLAKLIMKCNLLRVFVYRGQLDKFETIHQIFDFLIEDKMMRIKKIEFFVVDDPCRPNGWTEAVNEAKDKYTAPLALKGISMSLGIWKM